MQDKVCLVTGANSGLGYETSLAMARKGAEVIMVCRSRSKAESARERIIKITGSNKLYIDITDLSSQNEVRSLGKRIQSRYGKLDVLVNNAGLVLSDRNETQDGIETIFAVNYLAPFLLTHLLFPLLKNSEEARIVNVSSNNHFNANMRMHDLQHKKNFSGLSAYGQSKLANILFTYELHRRLEKLQHHNISANALDPGLVNTHIGNKDANWIYKLAWKFRKRQGISAAEGALTQIHLASSPEVKGISGKYWRESKMKKSSSHTYNEELAEDLWEISKNLCNMENYFS